MMVVVCFSCNFDVLTGGGEPSVYWFCHLDRTSTFLEDFEV